MTDRITSHVKVSIGRRTLLFDDDFVELHAFEDELKHLDEKAPELIKVRSITLMHSLCHMDCIKEKKHSSFHSGVTVGKDVGSIIDWSAAISSLTNFEGHFQQHFLCVYQHSGEFIQQNMSLAEASETRKARLTALKKRKAGEAVDEEG